VQNSKTEKTLKPREVLNSSRKMKRFPNIISSVKLAVQQIQTRSIVSTPMLTFKLFFFKYVVFFYKFNDFDFSLIKSHTELCVKTCQTCIHSHCLHCEKQAPLQAPCVAFSSIHSNTQAVKINSVPSHVPKPPLSHQRDRGLPLAQ